MLHICTKLATQKIAGVVASDAKIIVFACPSFKNLFLSLALRDGNLCRGGVSLREVESYFLLFHILRVAVFVADVVVVLYGVVSDDLAPIGCDGVEEVGAKEQQEVVERVEKDLGFRN